MIPTTDKLIRRIQDIVASRTLNDSAKDELKNKAKELVEYSEEITKEVNDGELLNDDEKESMVKQHKLIKNTTVEDSAP